MRTTPDHHASGLTCRDARSLFGAYLDGELSAALATELNAHRLSCSACRHELALLEVAGQVVAADEGVPGLDADFTARLLACVAAQPKSRWARLAADRERIMRWGLRGLAAAASIGLLVGYLNRPQSQVAGVMQPNPEAVIRSGPAPQRESAELSSEDAFQVQLERALTGWRRDASSLRKIYDFITPQILEEMKLGPAEGSHDLQAPFEPPARVPGRTPEPAPSGAAPEIEDI